MPKTDNTATKPIILDLKDAGKQTVRYIDLYDEGRFGADNLVLRGSYTGLSEVETAIKEVLASGSPMENPPSTNNILAFNRWNSPKSHWKRYAEPGTSHISRSAYIIHFALVIHWLDFCSTIGFGIKWAKYRDNNGKINKHYPLGMYSESQVFDTDNLRVLYMNCISKDDTRIIMESLDIKYPFNDYNIDFEKGEIDDSQLNNILKNDVFAGDNIITYEDKILHIGKDLLTVTI